jgi:hypothetical protein
MANLGPCLTFYLRYPEEMDYLYWGPRHSNTEPDFSSFENEAEARTMVEAVGDSASREAEAFLHRCAKRIVAHLSRLARLTANRRYLVASWQIQYCVTPQHVAGRKWYIGVTIVSAKQLAVPWVWCRLDQESEDEIIKALDRKGLAPSTDLGWNAGTVELTRIPMLPASGTSEVDADALVDSVGQAIEALTEEDVKALAAIAGRSP